jgi:hypothetical protein
MAEGRRQEAEDRSQRTDGRRQKTEGRGQKTEGIELIAADVGWLKVIRFQVSEKDDR